MQVGKTYILKEFGEEQYEKNEKIKSYFIIGGMPEVVKTWVSTKDIEAVNRIQKQILNCK